MNRHKLAFPAIALFCVLGTAFSASAAERVSRTIGEVKIASSEIGAPVEVVPTLAQPVIAATAAAPCARKVKMIYAGYGEADRASCAVGSASKAP
jgi:hypothetical protein